MAFIIRHKPTGYHFPCRPGLPQTHLEFDWRRPPRLFSKRGVAKAFLTTWGKGPLVTRTEYTESPDWFGKETSTRIEAAPDPENPRVLEEYEVLEVEVRILTTDRVIA